MKKTNRNRNHRRPRLMGWMILRNTLVAHALESYHHYIRNTPPPLTWKVKADEPFVEQTEEQRRNREAVPIVVVQVQAKEWPPHDPLPRLREHVGALLIRRPR